MASFRFSGDKKRSRSLPRRSPAYGVKREGNAGRQLRAERLEDRRLLYATYVGGGDWDLYYPDEGPYPDAKWSFKNISYGFSNLLDGWATGLTNSQLISAVEEAMGLWTSVAPLTFFELPDSGPGPGGLSGGSHSAYDEYDPIGHPYLRWGHHPIDGSMGQNTLAHGQIPGDHGGNGDIHFDDGNTFLIGDFLETAIHEFGHALGVAHTHGDVSASGVCPAAKPAIMDACAGSYNFAGLGSAFLFDDDANAIRSLYGSGLGYVLNSVGILHVWGTSGDDLMTVNIAGGNITVTSSGAKQGNVSFTRSIAGVTAVHMHGLDGNDILRVEDNDANKPILAIGDKGNDFLDVQFVNRNFDRTTGDITFWGGADADTVWLYDNNNPDPDRYTHSATAVTRPSFGDNFRFFYDDQLEFVRLFAGSAANVLEVVGTSPTAKLFINNQGGTDTVKVGLSNLAGILGDIEINNAPSLTTIEISDGNNTAATQATIQSVPGASGYSGLFRTGGDVFWKNSDTSIVTYTTGSGNDQVEVWDNTKGLNLASTGGDDAISLGNSVVGMQSIVADISISAQNGAPTITCADVPNAAGRTISIDDHLNGAFQKIVGLAPATVFYTAARAVRLDLGRGGDNVTFNDDLLCPLTLNAGPGNDNIRLAALNAVRLRRLQGQVIGYTEYAAILNGGADLDTFVIDDRQQPAQTFVYTLSENSLRAESGIALLDTIRYTFDYSLIESLTLQANNQPNEFIVTGTSPDIANVGQTTLYGGAAADVFTAYPHDAAGNLKFQSGIGMIGGGAVDSFYLDESASSTGVNWVINNFYGAGTQNFGFGGAPIIGTLNDLENLYVLGSQGNDRYDVEQFQSGASMRISGNGGNDTARVSPTTKRFSTTITSMPFFSFDGGPGISDALELYNTYEVNGATYQQSAASLLTTRPGYSAQWFHPALEKIIVHGGQTDDLFNIQSTPAGAEVHYYGGGGGDFYHLGNVGSVQGIVGPVSLHNDQGADSARIDDSLSGVGKRIHVTASSVGSDSSDTLFPGSGEVRPIGLLGTLEMRLGSGSDFVTASPSPTTALSITGGSPTLPPGDRIAVALNGASPTSVTTVGGVTTYAFSTRRNLAYSGFESLGAIGDLNSDGYVDGADMLTWQRGLGRAPVGQFAGADADGDGLIDAGDLAIWQASFNGAAVGSLSESATSSASVDHVKVFDAVYASGDFTAVSWRSERRPPSRPSPDRSAVRTTPRANFSRPLIALPARSVERQTSASGSSADELADKALWGTRSEWAADSVRSVPNLNLVLPLGGSQIVDRAST